MLLYSNYYSFVNKKKSFWKTISIVTNIFIYFFLNWKQGVCILLPSNRPFLICIFDTYALTNKLPFSCSLICLEATLVCNWAHVCVSYHRCEVVLAVHLYTYRDSLNKQRFLCNYLKRCPHHHRQPSVLQPQCIYKRGHSLRLPLYYIHISAFSVNMRTTKITLSVAWCIWNIVTSIEALGLPQLHPAQGLILLNYFIEKKFPQISSIKTLNDWAPNVLMDWFVFWRFNGKFMQNHKPGPLFAWIAKIW